MREKKILETQCQWAMQALFSLLLNPLMTSSGGKKDRIRKKWKVTETTALLEWLRQEGFSAWFNSCSQQSTFNISSAECHTQLSFKYLRGWRLGSLSQQPVPLLNHSPGEKRLSLVRGDRSQIHWIVTGTKNLNQSTCIYSSHEAKPISFSSKKFKF